MPPDVLETHWSALQNLWALKLILSTVKNPVNEAPLTSEGMRFTPHCQNENNMAPGLPSLTVIDKDSLCGYQYLLTAKTVCSKLLRW